MVRFYALVVIGFMLLGGVAGVATFIGSRNRNESSVSGSVLLREGFDKKFLGMSLDSVRATLGAPDEIDTRMDVWVYRSKTKKSVSSEPDAEARLQHLDCDRVTHIGYVDPK
jgi:hypothetical protein